jgi:hypothetical protein
MDQALRRHLARRPLVARAGEVVDSEPAPRHQGTPYQLEPLPRRLALLRAQQTHPPEHVARGRLLAAQRLGEPVHQRLHVTSEQPAGIELVEKLMHRHQRQELVGGEP